jgi:hypothetical protein
MLFVYIFRLCTIHSVHQELVVTCPHITAYTYHFSCNIERPNSNLHVSILIDIEFCGFYLQLELLYAVMSNGTFFFQGSIINISLNPQPGEPSLLCQGNRLVARTIYQTQPAFYFASRLSPLINPQALFTHVHLHYLSCDVSHSCESNP